MVLFLRSLGLAAILVAIACLSASVFMWHEHGARTGLWETSVQTTREIPIVEGMPELGFQQQVIWEEKLVLGIETPIVGTILFIVSIATSLVPFYVSSKISKKVVE
ncbi:MAG: hypothetical protein HN531_14595 [Opitutae bacterium]|jgi:hypothetical protein|nr:hypothetical protein [Opitutae bacterium]